MKQPVDHIVRPQLPWRGGHDEQITECGYDASKVSTITRAEFSARIKDLGQQRTAMLTCMTCADTSRRWADWETDARLAVGREITWEAGGGYYRTRTDRGERLKDELHAIADLIAAHRQEFDDALEQRAKRRDWLEQKAAVARKPKPQPLRSL